MSSGNEKSQSDNDNGRAYDEKDLGIEPSTAYAESVPLDDNRNGQFHRSFTPRQIHIIALGSNIGSGVFVGTGVALSRGGPGNMVIAYFLVGTAVWAVLQTLSEMTIAFPTSGNYIDYAGRWVDPALAFGAGFAGWLGWCAVVGAEAVFFDILLQYWARDAVPLAASLTMFVFVTMVIFLLPNKVFAWFEYVTSIIKIFLFLIIICVSIALVAGAGPNGRVHNGETWRELPPFKNGFFGFANATLLAAWAVGDQVFFGIMGGEAESPRFSMARATKLVPFRVNFVYMLSVIFITLLVRSDDPRLFGGSGVTASPFVIAVDNGGIAGVGHILNAGMIIGILAISAETIYLASRVLRTMAHQKLIPEIIARVDSRGRPRWALLVSILVALLLTYINLSSNGREGFTWLISITNSSLIANWAIISFTSWRFHKALRAQNDPLFTQIYAWRSSLWPAAPAWMMVISLLLFACCLTNGIGQLDISPFDPRNFFQYMIGILINVTFTSAYKIIMRTPWRDPRTANLVTGRRPLGPEEIGQLDKYYSMPMWRRFASYWSLW